MQTPEEIHKLTTIYFYKDLELDIKNFWKLDTIRSTHLISERSTFLTLSKRMLSISMKDIKSHFFIEMMDLIHLTIMS